MIGSPVSSALAIVHRFARARVLVVGDVMLDHFLLGRVHRLSPEAPVPVVEHRADEYRLGGAANVAGNVRALGGQVRLVGVVGADASADLLRTEIRKRDVDGSGLITDPDRVTTRKMRVITERRQQVARVDYESDVEVSGTVADALEAAIHDAIARVEVVVVSDYCKGVVSARLTRALIAAAHDRRVPVIVDPKVPHLDRYAGADLVTPNHHEAEVATHLRIRTREDARLAARAFRERAACRSVLITWGEHGMWLLDGPALDAADQVKDGDQWMRAEVDLPATAREVADVTGAGDTVVATIALATACGAGWLDAAQLANQAAGLVVAKFGPATVTSAELGAAVTARA